MITKKRIAGKCIVLILIFIYLLFQPMLVNYKEYRRIVNFSNNIDIQDRGRYLKFEFEKNQWLFISSITKSTHKNNFSVIVAYDSQGRWFEGPAGSDKLWFKLLSYKETKRQLDEANIKYDLKQWVSMDPLHKLIEKLDNCNNFKEAISIIENLGLEEKSLTKVFTEPLTARRVWAFD